MIFTLRALALTIPFDLLLEEGFPNRDVAGVCTRPSTTRYLGVRGWAEPMTQWPPPGLVTIL